MKFIQAAAATSVFCVLAGLAATTTAKSTTHKSTPGKSAQSKSASKKAPAAGHTASKGSSSSVKTVSKRVKGKTVKAPPVSTWRTRQQAPTPDRYKEIQQALVDKGYLKGEPTGVWDADSADALLRFQQDQKLTPTGKINAPSLIGLGLGAKSAGASEASPIRQEAPPSTQDSAPAADPPAPAGPGR